MISRGAGVVALVLLIALSASAGLASQTQWNVKLLTYVGEIGGLPSDINPKMGVTAGATDGYDEGIDLPKPPLPFDYVWTWFERSAWGKGNIQTDYRSEVAEATSKVWDDIRVKVKVAQDLSGVGDECVPGQDPCDVTEYYIASAIYLTWEFGTADQAPPGDYEFTLQYKGGINAKPAGTAPAGVTVPAFNTTWDMKTSSNIVFPLWKDDFSPCDPSCQFQLLVDTAKFNIIVNNPNQPPVCDFTYSPSEPTTADTVQFTDASSDPDGSIVSWDWDFGDGNTSTDQNPTHQYAAPGDYVVSLTVTDNGGASAVCQQQTITVTNQPPTCGFSYSPTEPTTADTIQFTDTSSDPDGSIVSWAWDFADGNTSTDQNPTHQYAAAGDYIVSLTVTDNEGAFTDCQQTITVTSGPAAEDNWNCNLQVYWGALAGFPKDIGDYFGVAPGASDEYDLIDSKKPAEPMGDYAYAWFERPDWGMGRIMADWRAPIPDGTSKRWGTSAIKDTWNIKTNVDNGPSGYFDPTCDPFEELEYPIAADIYVTWQFGVSETPPYPVPPDDYTFEMMYRGGINAKPAGTGGSVEPPTINQTWDMEATEYIVIPLWNDAFGPWSQDCASFMAPDAAKFLFTVTNPPDVGPTCTIAVEPPSPQEAPATYTFTATGSGGTEPYTFAWDFADGGSDTGNPVSHTYTEVGTYTITCTVTDFDNLTGECTTTVEVPPPCPSPVCCFTYAPESPTDLEDVQFTDCSEGPPPQTIVSWAWNFDDGNTSTQQNPIHRFADDGSYTVTLTVTNDCDPPQSDTCSHTVDVINVPPNCGITFSPLAPTSGQTITFDSHATDPDGTIASVSWDFDDGGIGDGVTTTHEYACIGVYSVIATAVDDDGAQNTCSIEVTVSPGSDSTPPTIAITSPPPPPPITVWSGVVAAGGLAATADDCESGVSKVEFFVDGQKIGEDDTAPYEAPEIDTTAYGNGAHYLGAKAWNGYMTLSAEISWGVDFDNPFDPGTLPIIRQTVTKTGLLGMAPNYQIQVNLTVKNVGGVAAENVTLLGFAFVGSYLDAESNLVLVNIPAHPTSGSDWPRQVGVGGTLNPGDEETIELLSDVFQAPPITRVSRWMDYGTFTVGPNTYTF